MDDEFESDTRMVPPGKMAKSFLIVAGAYMMFIVSLFGTYLAISFLFFPDVFKSLQDPDVVAAAMNTNPESVLPRNLFWGWLVINSVLCLMLGWTIARLAPFGKFPHAVFFAILVFVSCLQQAIGAPQSIAWMFVLLMGALPISVLFGASRGVPSTRAFAESQHEQDGS